MPSPVEVIRRGEVGRPRKILNDKFLREVCSNQYGLHITEIARLFNVHRNTLYPDLRRLGLTHRFSKISDHSLDTLVRAFKIRKPELGLRSLIGYLRHIGLRVQTNWVLTSMRRVDALGKTLRHRKAIQRRQYHNKRPNAVWHMDGYHKLIRWGIVIHGVADGYCRTVSPKTVIFSY